MLHVLTYVLRLTASVTFEEIALRTGKTGILCVPQEERMVEIHAPGPFPIILYERVQRHDESWNKINFPCRAIKFPSPIRMQRSTIPIAVSSIRKLNI